MSSMHDRDRDWPRLLRPPVQTTRGAPLQQRQKIATRGSFTSPWRCGWLRCVRNCAITSIADSLTGAQSQVTLSRLHGIRRFRLGFRRGILDRLWWRFVGGSRRRRRRRRRLWNRRRPVWIGWSGRHVELRPYQITSAVLHATILFAHRASPDQSYPLYCV